MPRKKAVPPAETPETEIVTSAPEAAPETPSTAQPQALEASPVPPVSPQAEPSVMPEPEPSAPPAVPEEETASPEAEPEAAQVPESLPAIVTASKGLNFRAGPGFSFDVLGVVEFGTLLIVLDLPMGVKVPGWALVWLGETAGWVSDKYLRLLVD